MLVIPAVDVRGGNTVRLRQGDYAHETAYAPAPEALAHSYAAAGAARLHLVDLDAARGAPDERSRDAVRRAVRAANDSGCEVQVGGGVRTVQDAQARLEEGASFVVIGSIAVRDSATARAVCDAAAGRVLIALDVHDGAARVEGWTQHGMPMEDALARWSDWPIAGIVYTDTVHDGMLDGPDLNGLERCRELFSGDVYLSGGVRGVADVVAAAAHGAAGVVVGRALLDGRLQLHDALDAVAAAP